MVFRNALWPSFWSIFQSHSLASFFWAKNVKYAPLSTTCGSCVVLKEIYDSTGFIRIYYIARAYSALLISHNTVFKWRSTLFILTVTPVLYRNIFPVQWFINIFYGSMHVCPENYCKKRDISRFFVVILTYHLCVYWHKNNRFHNKFYYCCWKLEYLFVKHLNLEFWNLFRQTHQSSPSSFS